MKPGETTSGSSVETKSPDSSSDAKIPAGSSWIEGNGAWRAIFDAIPAWMFLVDEDIHILAYNAAAAGLLSPKPAEAIGHRGGDVLHCIHSTESELGCGHAPFCADCMIRNAVRDCYRVGHTTRQRNRMQLYRNSQVTDLFLLITVTPVRLGDRNLALLILEDITELTELERIIPICAGCRKVRLESSNWEPVEVHFRNRLEIEFTHGLCPDCLSRYNHP